MYKQKTLSECIAFLEGKLTIESLSREIALETKNVLRYLKELDKYQDMFGKPVGCCESCEDIIIPGDSTGLWEDGIMTCESCTPPSMPLSTQEI